MRIATQVQTDGFSGRPENPMVNLEYGAQNGYIPSMAREIAGKQFEEWISNSAHISTDITAFCLRTPKIFDILENADLGKKLRSIYIDLFTVHPLSITGFNRTVTLSTIEHRIGATEEMQEEVVGSKKTRTQLTYTFEEKLGESISRMIEFLLTYGIMDYRTRTALITTLKTGVELRKGNVYTPDYFTGTFLFVELDRINVNVQNAYIGYNFFPKTTGELTNQRNLGEDLKDNKLSVPCAGIYRSDSAVKAYAQEYIEKVTILRKNPDDISNIGITKAEADAVSSSTGGYNTTGYNTDVDGFKNNIQNAFGKKK